MSPPARLYLAFFISLGVMIVESSIFYKYLPLTLYCIMRDDFNFFYISTQKLINIPT